MTSRREVASLIAGPVVLLVVTIGYNTVATKKKVPTISTGIRWAARDPFGAWVAGGVIGGLLAHWFLTQESEST